MIKSLQIKRVMEISFDYFIVPLFIFIFLFEPNFLHGYIFSFDEGQHLAWISGILKGKVPYRDLYMIYGPLLEYIPALLMKLFGPSLQVLRAFYHFGTIFSLMLGYFLIRIILKSRLFVFISSWLLINLTVMPMWSSRWGGIRLGSGFLVLLFLIFYLKKQKRILLYLSGVFTGLSFLISQEMGICAIIACILSLIGINYYWKENLRKFVQKIIIYILGTITILVPFFIYFLLKGAFLQYLRIMFFDVPFKFPLVYRDDYPFLSLPNSFSIVIWMNYLSSRTFYFYGSIAIYGLSLVHLFKRIIQKKVSIDILHLLMLVSFGLPLLKTATRMLGGPQFNISLPPILIIACLFLEKISFKFRDSFKNISFDKSNLGRNEPCFCGSGKKYKNCCLEKSKILFLNLTKCLVLSLIILLSFFFIFIITRPDINLKRMSKKFNTYKKERQLLVSLNLKRAKKVYVPQAQAVELTAVIEFLENKVASGESIFVLPHEGHYYFFLDRLCATRFDSALFAQVDPSYQTEVIQAIEEEKAPYIIYNKTSYLVTDNNPIPNEERIAEIVDYVLRSYTLEKQFGGTLILRRKTNG
ncbi:MAG: SEC-C metal-binding domain-containing protein [Candidatus Omnitrophota bacterium]